MPLIPPDLSIFEAVFLATTSGIASFMTAVLGIGGGLLMLAVMAQLVPAAALIPAHGLVQLGSNGNRALMLRQHIHSGTLKLFLIGATLGAILASFVVVQLPIPIIELTVGLFILWMAWTSKSQTCEAKRTHFPLLGLLTTVLTMFVGATGPLVAAAVHRSTTDKLKAIATFSSCMASQNLLKVLVFSAVGFQLAQWLPLILIMIAAGALGTWAGLHLQKRIPGDRFRLIFKITLTLLALRLLWLAASELLG